MSKLRLSGKIELFFAAIVALVILILNISIFKIQYWGEKFYLLDKSIDVGLWYFGVLLTLITIIHQGDNPKIEAMRKYKSINRLNSINRRAVFLSLFASILGIALYSCRSLIEVNSIYSVLWFNVLLFIWVWLLLDLLLFLLVFYNLFQES